MRKLMFLLVASFVIIACDEQKKKPVEDADAEIVITDTTVYGTCADAANFTFLLELANGDTIEYITLNDSDAVDNVVVGGLYNNDRLAVIAYRNADGENIARRVINLTSVAGKWKDGDRKIDLNEGADWKMLNGSFIVDGDTFSVFDVTADTLTIEDNNGIYFFERIE